MSNIDIISGKEKSSLSLRQAISADKDNINNEAGYVYDRLSEIQAGRLTNTTRISRELYTLPSDFPAPFSQAVRLYAPVPLTNTSYAGIGVVSSYSAKKAISYWVEVEATSIYDIKHGFEIRGYRGLNDAITQTLSVFIQSKSEYPTIKSTIDAGNVYERDDTDYIVRCRNYVEYDGRTFLHIECEMITNLLQADYLFISFNSRMQYYVAGEEPDVLIFGFQVFDNFDDIKYNVDIPLESMQSLAVKEGVKNSTYRDTHDLNNYISDKIQGGGQILSEGSYQSYIASHDGYIRFGQSVVTSVIDDPKFYKKYTIAASSGNLLKLVSGSEVNELFSFLLPTTIDDTGKDTTTLNFWIKRSDLQENGLVLVNNSGVLWYIRHTDMMCKGFRETRDSVDLGTTAIEVLEIDGDYSHLQFSYSVVSSGNNLKIALYNTSANELTKLSFYNMSVVETKNVDPYYDYTSQAFKSGSQVIGKNAVLIGDSQYNDYLVAHTLVHELGINVLDHHYGGHSMKIKSANYASTNYMSFYHQDLRNAVIDEENVDLYIFTCSTNDGSGGGTLDLVDIQFVIDNYPAYGDDAGTVASKQALFDAIYTNNPSDIDTYFAFQQCYAAYLKQLFANRTDAKVLLCTVPISCSGLLTGAEVDGHGVWAVGEDPDTARTAVLDPTYNNIANEINEVGTYFSVPVADTLKGAGLTFENFIYHCIDGTHWDSDIKYNIAHFIKPVVEKLMR